MKKTLLAISLLTASNLVAPIIAQGQDSLVNLVADLSALDSSQKLAIDLAKKEASKVSKNLTFLYIQTVEGCVYCSEYRVTLNLGTPDPKNTNWVDYINTYNVLFDSYLGEPSDKLNAKVLLKTTEQLTGLDACEIKASKVVMNAVANLKDVETVIVRDIEPEGYSGKNDQYSVYVIYAKAGGNEWSAKYAISFESSIVKKQCKPKDEKTATLKRIDNQQSKWNGIYWPTIGSAINYSRTYSSKHMAAHKGQKIRQINVQLQNYPEGESTGIRHKTTLTGFDGKKYENDGNCQLIKATKTVECNLTDVGASFSFKGTSKSNFVYLTHTDAKRPLKFFRANGKFEDSEMLTVPADDENKKYMLQVK